jgi:hypothetical protein
VCQAVCAEGIYDNTDILAWPAVLARCGVFTRTRILGAGRYRQFGQVGSNVRRTLLSCRTVAASEGLPDKGSRETSFRRRKKSRRGVDSRACLSVLVFPRATRQRGGLVACVLAAPPSRFLTAAGKVSCYCSSWRDLRRRKPESLVGPSWRLRRLQLGEQHRGCAKYRPPIVETYV